MPLLRRSTFFALVALLASVLLTACSQRQLVVGSIADELAAQGQASENDLDLAREASAFYLKLSESVLRSDPGHRGLAESVAGGFTQYAYAFVAFEADRIEAKDAKAAESLRQRAARSSPRRRPIGQSWRRLRSASLTGLRPRGAAGFRCRRTIRTWWPICRRPYA